MASYETMYPGATFLLDPEKNYTGFRVPPGQLGATTSIQTANQLGEVNKLLNQGIKTTEISIISADVFEMIPKEMFKEINRLNQLTGAESTLHAPTLDPSGFTEQGWSEDNRRAVQRQFEEVVTRAHDVDPNGNIPVTIHSSGVPGTVMMPAQKDLMTPEEIKSGVKEVVAKMIAVDRESGKFIPLEREKRFYPELKSGAAKGRVYTPEEELEMHNASHWQNQLSNLLYYKQRADELITKNVPKYMATPEDERTDDQRLAYQNAGNAKIFLQNTYSQLRSLFNQAYKYSDNDGKKALGEITKKLPDNFGMSSDINDFAKGVQILINEMQRVTNEHQPEMYVPVEKFVNEKASETLGSVAFTTNRRGRCASNGHAGRPQTVRLHCYTATRRPSFAAPL